MSIRTIVEINHDYLYNWINHPEEAAKLLTEAVQDSGRGQTDFMLNSYGIRLIAQKHHADELTIKVT